MRAVTINEPLPTCSGAAFWAEAAPATARRLTEAIRAAAVFIGSLPDIRRVGRGPGFDVCMTLRQLASRRLDPTQVTDIYKNIFLFPLIPADVGIQCFGFQRDVA